MSNKITETWTAKVKQITSYVIIFFNIVKKTDFKFNNNQTVCVTW